MFNSRLSIIAVVVFNIASFYAGQFFKDMNLFAASGGIMTVFGLLLMIRFTTLEKYLNQESIAAASTGVTGPPLSEEEAKRLKRENIEKAKVRINKELQSELSGLALTIFGTVIWAYGTYIPFVG